MKAAVGVYVETAIHDSFDHLWILTQDPALHQRWDLRFSRISYLPRATEAEPQFFLYETRIGFGLSVAGTGESIAERAAANGEVTSSLKFVSADPKSLILEGSGYWRYVPTGGSVRFLTWYDYRVRFGAAGRLADCLVFRPFMAWATAWSFDRLRIWAETGRTPEATLSLALIHAVARSVLATVYIWQGLIPKLLYRHMDERTMLAQSGIPVSLLPLIGFAEVVFGVLLLACWHRRYLFFVNLGSMLIATATVAAYSPAYLKAAFNPFTLNLAMIGLSIIGWLSSATLPSACHCRRSARRDSQ